MDKQKILFSYTFQLDVWAILLFVAFMVPYGIWSFTHGENDLLDVVSNTPIADAIGMVFQVIMLALLMLFRSKDAPEQMNSVLKYSILLTAGGYLACWVAYWAGGTSVVIPILMALLPCLSFACLCLARRARMALLMCAVFSSAHLIYAIVNFC